MIKPGRSDGLFDFADILSTVMHLAGVPSVRHIPMMIPIMGSAGWYI